MYSRIAVTMVVTNCGYRGNHELWLLATLYYCMPPDDGCMTETCCDNNIRGREEELLR
jgi:hypothetical protein